MKRANQNFLTDSLIFVLFFLLAATGLFLHFKLPPGSHGDTVWGLGRHDWGEIHFWMAITFIAILIIHLILHWNWIVCMIKGRYQSKSPKARRNILLSIAVVVLLTILSVSPFLSSIEHDERAEKEQHGQEKVERRGGGGRHGS